MFFTPEYLVYSGIFEGRENYGKANASGIDYSAAGKKDLLTGP